MGVTAAAAVAAAAAPAASAASSQVDSFVSAPTLHPPKLAPSVHANKGLSGGYLMIGAFKNLALPAPQVGQGGPLIFDYQGRPVWIGPTPPTNQYTLNLQKQTYNGAPVLSWWFGSLTNTGQPTSGTYHIVNQHYHQIATITGTNGWVLSMHDFIITKQGTALVTAYKVVPQNLSSAGGSANGSLLDTAVQEYDIKTGKLVYQWDALGHIGFNESYTSPTPQGAWDAYHLNSIAEDSAGHLLISMRNTYGIYEIDKATGAIVWRLGGKLSSFALPANARFAWQHDARYQPNGEISLFDDECCGFLPGGKTAPPVNGVSRGLVLKLDATNHTASVVHQYTHSGLVTGSQGNTQVLPNGNVLVGWGQQPFLSEYNSAGKLLYDLRFPDPDTSYRAFLYTWKGSPLTQPNVAVRRLKRGVRVYVSWNGATQVSAWRVLAGGSRKKLKVVVKKAGRRAFETAIRVKAGGRVFRVEALDSRGHVIGTSKVVGAPKPSSNPSPSPIY